MRTLNHPVVGVLGDVVAQVLRRAGIDTVGDLADRTAADLLDLHGFGARGLDLVVSELGTRGLCLRLRDPRACSCGATGTDTCPAHGCYGTEPW